jgi:hypothetical protein
MCLLETGLLWQFKPWINSALSLTEWVLSGGSFFKNVTSMKETIQLYRFREQNPDNRWVLKGERTPNSLLTPL